MNEVGNVDNTQTVITQNNVDNDKKVEQQPKVDLSDPVDTVEFTTKEDNNTENKEKKNNSKVALGIASAICPGSGQLANGEAGKAAKYFFGLASTYVLSAISAVALGPGAIGVAIFSHTCIGIASAKDAVKNIKND